MPVTSTVLPTCKPLKALAVEPEVSRDVYVDWQSDEDRVVKAELNWTADRGTWQERKWSVVPMEIFVEFASAEGRLPAEATCWYVNLFTEDGKCVSGELTERTDSDISRDKLNQPSADAKLPRTESTPLPDGIDAAFDFVSSPGRVRRELHGASWVTRSYPRGFMNDDKAIAALKLDSFRTHDAPLVNSGQNIVDTHEIFPLMHLDAKDPKNYVFKPTDHFLELNFNLGMKCLYRLGTSIVFTTQVELGFHDTPLSKSHFYGCGVDGCWGYLDHFRRPNKTYYAMQAMGELMASCKERAVACTARRSLGAFGAWTANRRGASMIVSDFRGVTTELKVSVKGLPDWVMPQVRILDDRNDLVTWGCFSWQDGILTLHKSDPGSVVFAVDWRQ